MACPLLYKSSASDTLWFFSTLSTVLKSSRSWKCAQSLDVNILASRYMYILTWSCLNYPVLCIVLTAQQLFHEALQHEIKWKSGSWVQQQSVSHWLRMALSKGPVWVGTLYLMMETFPFWNNCVGGGSLMDTVQNNTQACSTGCLCNVLILMLSKESCCHSCVIHFCKPVSIIPKTFL